MYALLLYLKHDPKKRPEFENMAWHSNTYLQIQWKGNEITINWHIYAKCHMEMFSFNVFPLEHAGELRITERKKLSHTREPPYLNQGDQDVAAFSFK